MELDVAGFVRDGWIAVRGAFDAATAEACRELIWDALGERGVRGDDPSSWPVSMHLDGLGGGPFDAAGTSPALTAACDQLIGEHRWTSPVKAGDAAAVRFPSEERGNAGYHIEGRYDGPGGYWVNVRSRARGLLALLLFTDVGPDDAPTVAGRPGDRRRAGHERRIGPVHAQIGSAERLLTASTRTLAHPRVVTHTEPSSVAPATTSPTKPSSVNDSAATAAASSGTAPTAN
ncbi:hypothetical protein [Actinocrispum sp. NPDC049592]|uniref:hypothetical protein n=1 Tax=Actinocrispum sp. NPDC049592 TaxID=3154835 RepID=UPI00343B3E1B